MIKIPTIKINHDIIRNIIRYTGISLFLVYFVYKFKQTLDKAVGNTTADIDENTGKDEEMMAAKEFSNSR